MLSVPAVRRASLLSRRHVCASNHARHLHSRPQEPYRILFCGSDQFSVASLEELYNADDIWQSLSVLTPPEQRIGRGGKQRYIPPLQAFAIDAGIPFHTVPNTGLGEGFSLPHPFSAKHPTHMLVTASFGHIIPTPLMQPFQHALNVHPSLLPKYRGAAPIQWAIANGDATTGVTVQNMGPREQGIDSGAIIGAVDGVPIPSDATYPTLSADLAHVSAKLLVAVLRQMLRGEARLRPQDGEVSKAPKVTRERMRADWRQPAAALERLGRAFAHHTPLWAPHGGKAVQLVAVAPAAPQELGAVARPEGAARPGAAVFDKPRRRLLVLTGGDGALAVHRVKPAGRPEMDGADWWNGLPEEHRRRGWTVFE